MEYSKIIDYKPIEIKIKPEIVCINCNNGIQHLNWCKCENCGFYNKK